VYERVVIKVYEREFLRCMREGLLRCMREWLLRCMREGLLRCITTKGDEHIYKLAFEEGDNQKQNIPKYLMEQREIRESVKAYRRV